MLKFLLSLNYTPWSLKSSVVWPLTPLQSPYICCPPLWLHGGLIHILFDLQNTLKFEPNWKISNKNLGFWFLLKTWKIWQHCSIWPPNGWLETIGAALQFITVPTPPSCLTNLEALSYYHHDIYTVFLIGENYLASFLLVIKPRKMKNKWRASCICRKMRDNTFLCKN